MNLAFFLSIWNFIIVYLSVILSSVPYASLRGSEPIVGMDGSRWIWVIGSAFSPYSRYLLAILTIWGLYYGFF